MIYESENSKEEKVFDALEWLTGMKLHFPNKGEHMVHYYGCYNSAFRGLRQRKNLDDLISSILKPMDLKTKRTWGRLIQKIYEIDPFDLLKVLGEDENHRFY